MPDREKVIKALELEVKYPHTWGCQPQCPYYGNTEFTCYTQVAIDALELLKEQKQALKREYMRGYDKAWDEIGRG